MTNTPGKSRTRMSKLLEQELAVSKQLKKLLIAEQKAITDRDIPAFEEIIDKKRIVLERLAPYEQARIFLLESDGIEHGPESMDGFIKKCGDDGSLSELWKRLSVIATDCRDHNRQNHQLVELFSAHTRKALCVLRGETMETNVYGPDGDTSDAHENRSIAIA